MVVGRLGAANGKPLAVGTGGRSPNPFDSLTLFGHPGCGAVLVALPSRAANRVCQRPDRLNFVREYQPNDRRFPASDRPLNNCE